MRKQQLGINRGPPRVAVAILEPLANETEINVLIDQPQQVILGNVFFQSEVVEQCFGPGVLSHHDQQASGK